MNRANYACVMGVCCSQTVMGGVCALNYTIYTILDTISLSGLCVYCEGAFGMIIVAFRCGGVMASSVELTPMLFVHCAVLLQSPRVSLAAYFGIIGGMRELNVEVNMSLADFMRK